MKIFITILNLIIFTLSANAQCSRFTQIAGSSMSSNALAIKNDGTLWAWGMNTASQLGDGTRVSKNTPVEIGSATNWQSISVGFSHSLGITKDGKLWGWGNSDYGQVGSVHSDYTSPTQLGTDSNWQSISAGTNCSYAITSDGKLWAWGVNYKGQLGDPALTQKDTPTRIGTATNWKSISAGLYYAIGLTTDGNILAWGANYYGQLGNGTVYDLPAPTQIYFATHWKSIAAGQFHSLGISTDGKLWAWGASQYGQLGQGNLYSSYYPARIGSAANWKSIAAGHTHSLGLTNDGKLWAWGDNMNGELGDSTTIERNSPTRIGIANNWQSIVAGYFYSIGSTADGKSWSWGDHSSGALGTGTITDQIIPTILIGTLFPTITTQPVSQTKCAGTNDTLSVTAMGTGTLTYQWQKNGINITGATSATYIKNNIAFADSGYYNIVVTGACITFSDSVKLAVIALPDTTVVLSGRTMTSNTSGATYQWIDCITNSVIPGAINKSFTPSGSGTYSLDITQNGCKASSSCYAISFAGIIYNNLNAGVKLYPNPTYDKFTLDLGAAPVNLSLEIKDVRGKIIQCVTYIQTNKINCSINGVSGIYFITLTTADGNQVRMKVVKE